MRRPLLALLLALVLPSLLFGDEVDDRRAAAGIRLFRALLAADVDLPRKTVAPNQLLIVFFYVDDKTRAADLAQRFAADDKVHGIPMVTEVTNDPNFVAYDKRVPAGIFLADAPARQALASIIHWGITHRLIVYSPFEGHVEKGVLGGLSVEAQVRPYVNRATIEASQITLKPFFMEVAKVFQ
ncbi:MAG TPA: hypothetical protein VGJ81_04720 [Thermoanaerobaculia bacterium]|jgi:hypothetical protein